MASRSDYRRPPLEFLKAHTRLALLEQLTACAGIETAADTMHELLAGLDIAGFAFGTLYERGSSQDGMVSAARGLLANVAPDYAARNLVRGDPIARRLYRDEAPFSLADYFRAPTNREPGETRAEIITLMRRHGVTCGAGTPLHLSRLPLPGRPCWYAARRARARSNLTRTSPIAPGCSGWRDWR